MRRLTSTIVLCVLGLGLVPSVAAAPKGKGEVFMITADGVPMVPGQTGWTGIIWKAGDDDLTELSVTVEAPSGWGVTYPGNRVGDTSLWDNDTLSADEVDFTAFRLSVPENTSAPSVHSVDVYVSYSYLKNGKKEKIAGKRFTLEVPVVSVRNPALEQTTTSLGDFAADSQTWVDVLYKGYATAFDFRLSVTDPGGAAVTYPNDGTFTSLNGDDVLEVDENDRASFLLDTTGLAPGTYTMQTNVSHRVATQARHVAGSVTFNVLADAPAPAFARRRSWPGPAQGLDARRSESRQSLIEVEARRLCVVSKMTFFSADAMESRLAQRVTDAGHSLAGYETWRARLSRRPLARAKVYYLYRSQCGLQNPNDDPNATS